MKAVLVSIQRTITERVSATRTLRADWPCHAGCDDCCRSLAALPEVTQAEWDMLAQALEALPAPIRSEITQRLLHLQDGERPFTCPFLDLSSGRCLTYDSRPLACRTYGFYVERDEGLYCHRIQSMANTGQLADIVWGNQAGIDHASAPLGPRLSILEWFKRDLNDG